MPRKSRRKIDKVHKGDKKDSHRLLLAILFDLKEKKTQEFLDNLVMNMSNIPERNMKTLLLKEKIESMPDDFSVEIVNRVFSKARPGEIDSAMFILSMVDIYSFHLEADSQKLLKLYVICKDRGYDRTANFFLPPEPKRKPFSKFDFVEGREMDYITLGEKRSLAKTREKDILDRLLYDPSPLVVKNILENPRITEHDVIKMVSRRPNNESVLKTIFRSEKWLSSYNVKLAMIKNPYTPVGIALGLLFFLKEQDLRDVSLDRSLHDVIKGTAGDLLGRKGNYLEKIR